MNCTFEWTKLDNKESFDRPTWWQRNLRGVWISNFDRPTRCRLDAKLRWVALARRMKMRCQLRGKESGGFGRLEWAWERENVVPNLVTIWFFSPEFWEVINEELPTSMLCDVGPSFGWSKNGKSDRRLIWRRWWVVSSYNELGMRIDAQSGIDELLRGRMMALEWQSTWRPQGGKRSN